MSGISAASNRIGTDTVETRKDSISSVSSYTSSISSRDGPSGEKYSKISPQLPPFKFDSSRQQFVDSMKYTDLTLSVEPPGISNSVEIPCHKFMLAKKVPFQLLESSIFGISLPELTNGSREVGIFLVYGGRNTPPPPYF